MYQWLDGRTVLPYSLGLAYILFKQPDLMRNGSFVKDFYTLYINMTVLLWPTEWNEKVRISTSSMRAERQ